MIRVVIADDSGVFRAALTRLLENDGRIKVVGAAQDGQEAIDLVRALRPQLLILDYHMPGLDGIAALKVLMQECPLPVLMLSALTRDGAEETLRALEQGALDYFPKPRHGEAALDEIGRELVGKIEAIVQNNPLPFKFDYAQIKGREALDLQPLSRLTKRDVGVIAVGSSTGGVKVALNILSNLPASTKPLVWAQHMPLNFTASFAERLNAYARITVKEAQDGDVLRDSTCFIARAGFQVRVENKDGSQILRLYQEQTQSRAHAPSCDVLFDSVADLFGSRALGLILTGMGDDGTEGLCKMHAKGAFVIGQNEASSVVYGMARSALLAGAVDLELDVANIPEALIRLGGAARS